MNKGYAYARRVTALHLVQNLCASKPWPQQAARPTQTRKEGGEGMDVLCTNKAQGSLMSAAHSGQSDVADPWWLVRKAEEKHACALQHQRRLLWGDCRGF